MTIQNSLQLAAKFLIILYVFKALAAIDGFGLNIRSLFSFFVLSASTFICFIDVFLQRKKISYVALASGATICSVASGVCWALSKGLAV